MWYNFNKRILLVIIPPIIRLFGIKMPAIAAVSAIIEKDNKILSIRLAYKKGYSLPGGGVDRGETLEKALARELKEETNLDLQSFSYLGSNVADEGQLGVTSMCFKCTVKNTKNIISSSEGEISWEDPLFVYKNCAYNDIEKHLNAYFHFDKK